MASLERDWSKLHEHNEFQAKDRLRYRHLCMLAYHMFNFNLYSQGILLHSQGTLLRVEKSTRQNATPRPSTR
jgi:hypothetical protein